MAAPSILFESHDGVTEITLNRPERLNSFNLEMHERLREALGEVKRRSDIRVVLLTGAGRGFCAGQDLADRVVAPGAEPIDLGYTLSTQYSPLIRHCRVCRSQSYAQSTVSLLALVPTSRWRATS